MRSPFARATLLATLCTLSFAPALPTFAADATAVSQEKEDSPLAKLMSQMGKHFKALKKNVDKADKKDANVADFNGIAELADKCKAQVPDTAKTDADKKAYADSLDKLATTAKEGAKASADGKLDEAKKAFGDLKKLMGEGHKKFKKED